MADLGRMYFVVQDPAGNAVSGASVEIRKQGAQVSGNQGGPLTVFTVDAPNAVAIGDTARINVSGSTRSVTNVTNNQITVGAPGFGSLSDDDRCTVVSPLPTIYEDAEGNTSTANPLTTSSTGTASCYIVGGKYDVLISGAGITTTLLQDQVSVGAESFINNNWAPVGTGVSYWDWDTLRSVNVADFLMRMRSAGVNKFTVAGDGEIVAGIAGATHTLTGTLTVSSTTTVTSGGFVITAGGLTVSAGGAAITGNSTITGTLGGVTTITRLRDAQTSVTTLSGTTPDVSGGTVFNANYGGGTTVTNLTNGAIGQLVIIINVNANMTLQNNANIKLAGAANFVATALDTITLTYDGTTWYELARSIN